ncbi:hypothetical protein FXO38_35607 [Capsicum annuum]|nr:hypothetical protein FXO38_35607 [Capsicum annuum]
MLESTREANASASLPNGLLITQIFLFCYIDLFAYHNIEVVAPYDSRTFSSMGDVLVENEWCRKESARTKAEPLKLSKYVSNPSASLMKELDKFKKRFKTIEKGIMYFQKSTAKLVDIG